MPAIQKVPSPPSASILLPDGHHAEGNVLRRHVVGTAHLVDLVSLGHDDGVVLDDDGVGVHAVLEGVAIGLYRVVGSFGIWRD